MAGVTGLPAGATNPTNTRAAAGASGFNWNHVRMLLWLRWKLTWRAYTRTPWAVVGLVFQMIFLVGFVGGVGVGTALGYVFLPRDVAGLLLFAVLTALYILWVVLPLLQYTLNEGLDLTKLAIYPLTRAEQMVGLLLATLLDTGVVTFIAIYIAVVVGWHATVPATIITVVALILAYIHTVTISQLVLGALTGMLHSRRWRDLAILFAALFGVSCSLINQLLAPLYSRLDEQALRNIANSHADSYLQWLPPGMAARAITLADQGQYLAALPWLVVLVVLVPILLAIWARVLDYGITRAEVNEESSGRRKRRRAPAVPAASAPAIPAAATGAAARAVPATNARRWSPISEASLAIAQKDWLYFWRDPQIKAALASSLFVLVAVIVPQLTGTSGQDGREFIQQYGVLFAPLPTLSVVLTLSINAFGLEREGVQTLFLLPVRPLDVFWGKNLAVGVVAGAAQVIIAVALAALTGGWSYVPAALVVGFSAIFVVLACGNVTSMYVPSRVRQMRAGRGSFSSSENGCLRAILGFASIMATGALLAPVVGAVFLPLILGHGEWLPITLPASLLYGILLYQLVTRLVAPQFHTRAPEILRATVPES